MSFEWLTSKGVLGSYFEQETVSIDIEYTSDDSETYLNIISGNLPDGVVFNKTGNNKYTISGTLGVVIDSSIFNFTVRAYSSGKTFDRNFIIIVESYNVEWNSPTLFATTTEFTYLSEYFKLKNPNGNEVFKKISGELPEGVLINTFGLCYGTIGHIEESTDYQFRVGVFVNNELTLWKDFIIEVKTLSDLSQPIWITQEGNIGKVDFGQKVNIKLIAYEPNNLPLNYEIIEGILPSGLELNISNGQISGTVSTENQAQWDFTVSCTNGYKTIVRDFNIISNEVMEGDNITWITDSNLGEVSVGSKFNKIIEATSNYPITFDVISGGFPKGIKMTKDGVIYGNCYYQPAKDFEITIHAKNIKTESIKTFNLRVNKGLGYNSLRAYFYINLEYQDDFSKIKQMFDYEYSYNTYDENFAIPYKPEIYVADISCYDKPLLQYIINYNTYLKLTTSLTKVKNIIKEDEEGNIKHLYDVYYKDFKSSNNSNQEEYIDYRSPKHYIKPKDGGWVDYYTDEPVEVKSIVYQEETKTGLQITVDGSVYDVGYIHEGMYYTTAEQKVVYGNPKILSELVWNQQTLSYEVQYYYMNPTEKIYVSENENLRYFDKATLKVMFNVDIDSNPPEEVYETRYYVRDSNVVYVNIPSVDTMRKRLEQKIYVEKLTEDVWYDVNTEEILTPKHDKVFDLVWDEEAKSYWFEMDIMPYVILAAYDPITQHIDEEAYIHDDNTGETWQKVYILDENEFGHVYVNYQHFDVINKATHKPYRDFIFKLPEIDKYFMIDSYGVIRFVNKTNIEERNWYIYNKDLNTIVNKNLVLANIGDEDILNDGRNYIQFFDSSKEDLPEWMDGQYFPKIELFYSDAGQNYANQQLINNIEKTDYILTGESLSFYCLTFKPKYNEDIRPFDIHFDYHINPYTPHILI